MARDWVSWCLLVVAIGCFAVGLFPGRSERADPASGDRVSDWSLGLRFSPVWEYVRREKPDGGFDMRSGINVLSWSSLMILAGVVAFKGFGWRRRALVATS